MAESRFVYVIYIRTTAEELWRALTKPNATRQYWFNTTQESSWTPGAPWAMVDPNGRVVDSGSVVEIEPQKHLLLRWRHELDAEMRNEGFSLLTYNLEEQDEVVVLTITHRMEMADSKFIESIVSGWPAILSSLKSMLETGTALTITQSWPEGF